MRPIIEKGIIDIISLAEKYPTIKRIGIFGSFARDEENANDIDLLIEDDIDPDRLIQLKILLENSFQKKVDIVLPKFANPIILYRAQRDLHYATQY